MQQTVTFVFRTLLESLHLAGAERQTCFRSEARGADPTEFWPRLCRAVIVAVLVTLPAGSAQSILREVWSNLPGVAVADLTTSADFPSHPSSTNYVTDFFEAPSDVADNYGQRMHGYLLRRSRAPTGSGSPATTAASCG